MNARNHSLTLLISLIVILPLINSCFYGIRGNGKTVKTEREAQNFNSIKISDGLNLILTQDTTEKVLVKADENLQKIIKTDVSNGELKIYSTEHIFNPSSVKVYVTVKNLKEITSSSGSDVESPSVLNSSDFKVLSSSGSDVVLKLSCSELEVNSSSGSDVTLSGKTGKLIIVSSSGSDTNAEKMSSDTCTVSASSGSDVRVTVSGRIEVHASSGADITVHGNPIERDVEKSSGGSVSIR